MRIKVGSWNVAASPGTDKDLASWFIRGKGIDRRMAALDITKTPAFDRERTSDSLDADPNALRVVGGNDIGLYVLGLQEVVDLNVATQYVNRVVYTDANPSPVERWTKAMEASLPPGYQRIVATQMSGLLLLVYASPEIAPSIGNVSTSQVGTGILGYMGNKGAVSTRIILGEVTKLVLTDCHLASGEDGSALDRRMWDVGRILSQTKFEPISQHGVQEDEGEKIGDEDVAFWFGDLNFRLEGLPGDDIRRLLMLHTRGEYGIEQRPSTDTPIDGEDAIVLGSPSNSGIDSETESGTATDTATQDDDTASETLPDPDDFVPDLSEDPTSLQATLDSLLPHDQLRRMMKEHKVFHEGWREGPITFLPSYKYDIGTVGLFDSSEKRRAPSWCDRILFRTKKDREGHHQHMKDQEEARKKDEEMKARGLDHAGDEDEVLFDYDPQSDGDAQQKPSTASYDYYDEDEDAEDGGSPDSANSSVNAADRLQLEIYASHQRVQSSDHKPIVSIFSLDYDAVVPDLKAKVHAEVARELDRAENEGRPVITVIFDGNEGAAAAPEKPSAEDAADFGEIQFLSKKTRSLTIANTGRCSATFSFVEKPTTDELDDGARTVQWLSTSFHRGGGDTIDVGKNITLEPGETVACLLEVFVGQLSLARLLNDGQTSLDDVLVLRVEEGRDHFIPVRGSWLPTSLGRSMDELIRVPDGGIQPFLQSLAKEYRRPLAGSIPYDLDVRCAAPKELFKLLEVVESLTERVVADEQMLDEKMIPDDRPGWPFEKPTTELDDDKLGRLVWALDNDKPLSEFLDAEANSTVRLESAAHVLGLFLDGLTDGIVSAPLWTKIEQADLAFLAPGAKPATDTEEEDKAAILDILGSAPNHNISFVFLTTTIAKVLTELSPLSKTDVEALKASKPGSLGRRSLSFRRSGPSAAEQAAAALERRQTREKRVAEILGRSVCRPSMTGRKEKERKVTEERQTAVMLLFLRRGLEDGG
jgi:inositol polyphosphate 5-phosphatase INPP5B/F